MALDGLTLIALEFHNSVCDVIPFFSLVFLWFIIFHLENIGYIIAQGFCFFSDLMMGVFFRKPSDLQFFSFCTLSQIMIPVDIRKIIQFYVLL